MIISIIISGIVFYAYEDKVKKYIKLKNLFILLSSFSLVLIIFSTVNIYKNYQASRIKLNGVSYIIQAEKKLRWDYLENSCKKIGWEDCYKAQKNKYNFLVIGDSMSPTSGNIINYLYNINDIHIVVDTMGGCQPHPNIKAIAPDNHPNLKKCIKKNKERFSKEYYKDIDVIFIHNHYTWFKADYIIPYINFLQSIGKNKIVLVGNYINLDKDFVEILREKKIKSSINIDVREFSKNIMSNFQSDKELKEISIANKLFYISFKKLCKKRCNNCYNICPLFTDKGYPFTWDQFHISKEFMEYFVSKYLENDKLMKYLDN
jgi:hypothetical protein